jgi:arabinose-5-phosphate isomerase
LLPYLRVTHLKSHNDIIKIGIETIKNEGNAILGLEKHVTLDFAKTVNHILKSSGRVVITGIGKSANIAVKIVSTLNSTGTPAIFMHAADAIHGDLGIIQQSDVIICISNSGNTPEIKVLVPILKDRGNVLIAFTGNHQSYLAQHSDCIISTKVDKEACPNNLAPTSSTTAQLVMGDALAIALLECRGFTVDDFAKYHPGGALGKKLYLKVEDLYTKNESPQVNINDNIRLCIVEISSKRLGATAVLDNNALVGMITDGDLRRMLLKHQSIDNKTARDIMTPNPKTIDKDTLVVNALSIMRQFNITQLLVMDGINYVGVIHLHDILKEGFI